MKSQTDSSNMLLNIVSKQRLEKILNEKLEVDYQKYLKLIDLDQLIQAFRKYKV